MRRCSSGTCVEKLLLLSLVLAPAAPAQDVGPTAPLDRGALPADLVCSAETRNRSGPTAGDGSLLLFEVPALSGLLRVRAVCEDPLGGTVVAASPLAVPVAGGETVADPDFTTAVPVPTALAVSPPDAELVGVGSGVQLQVTASFVAGPDADVTAAASGTTYASSDPGVVSVGPDGLVSAAGLGSAVVSVVHDGVPGFATVTVVSAAVSSLAVAPAPMELGVNPLFPAPRDRLRVTGLLADGGTAELGSPSAGTTYTTSDPAVAVVDERGTVYGLVPGVADVTVSRGAASVPAQVVVNAVDPAPTLAFDTPGFAHAVDIVGTLVFVADGNGGLRLFDAAGSAPLPGLAFGALEALDVRVEGRRAAVVLSSGEVALVDTADPERLWELTRVGAGSGVVDVGLSGERLYAATAQGLDVYDLAGPLPVLVGTQALAAAPLAVAADAARGVTVVLTDEPALVVLETSAPPPWPSTTVALPSTDAPGDVALFGPSAYVAHGSAGLVRVDLTDPAAPAVAEASTYALAARGVAFSATARGFVVAAADDLAANAVALFDAELGHLFTVDFSTFPGSLVAQADGTGVALGERVGAVSVGFDGVQLFRTDLVADNGEEPPVVALTAPRAAGGVPAEASALLAAAAEDDVGVALVEFFVDGAPVDSDATPPFTGSFVAGELGTVHTVVARATDLAGFTADSLAVTVTAQAVPDPGGDEDFDGLVNQIEALLGTDPGNPDSDGDGWWDGLEVEAGIASDPLDPRSRPEVTVASAPPLDVLLPQVVVGGDPPGGFGTTVADPRVDVLLPEAVTGGDPPGGFGTTVADPRVDVLLPQVITGGDPPGGFGTTVADPRVDVLLPVASPGGDPPGGFGTTVADPRVDVLLPQVVTGGDPPGGFGTTVAEPRVNVLLPEVVTGGDPPGGGFGTTVADPRVDVLLPETATGVDPPEGFGTTVADPPVDVTIADQ